MSTIGDGAKNSLKSQLPTDPAASGKPSSRHVKLLGYCLLTEKQLEHYYKLHLISDEELATAGNDKKRSQECPLPKDLAQQVREVQLRLGIRPHKVYEFQLLNQLVRLMDAEPDPKVIFPEMLFNFDAIYCESERIRRLAPKERLHRRFDAFYDYLDHKFVHGDRNKVFEVVVDALIRLTRRRLQAGQKVPIASGYMSPRSFDLIPPHQGRYINLLDKTINWDPTTRP